MRGALQLGTEAVLGLSEVVEGVHQSVRGTLGLPGGRAAGRAGGLTGGIYATVRGITRAVGFGGDALLARLPVLPAMARESASGRREAWLAALNGVFGDRLAASRNPLATPMTLHHRGTRLGTAPLPLDVARPHLVVLLHGLCMNERQWCEPKDAAAVEPAAALRAALDCSVLHLRYNSGLPIAANGRALARLLERTLAHWPVPLERLSLVGHSMGGLVARAALAQAQRERRRWPALLRDLVCLGTPHFGAPLERIGHWVEGALRATPWSAPLARLGAVRSAGITDLRHGLRRTATGTPAGPALPPQLRCHLLAATLASRRSLLADRLLGDGLVPLRSALGEGEAAALPAHSRHVVHRCGHLQLLHHPEAVARLQQWLALT